MNTGVETVKGRLDCERGLKGVLHRLMPGRVALRPNSQEEFVELLKRRIDAGDTCSIEIGAAIVPEGEAQTISVGTIADFQYHLVCHATTGAGEKIQFERFLFSRFGSDRGVADREQRERDFFKLIMASREQRTVLQTLLPSALITVDNSVDDADDATRQRFDADAEKAGVTVSLVRESYFSETAS